MPNFGVARVVRINDEDTVTYQDGLDSCSWHYEEGKQLAREEHMVLLRRPSWAGSEPSHLPRSNTPLTRAEYTAWRTLAQPLMKASTQS